MSESAAWFAVALALVGLLAVIWKTGELIAFWATVALIVGFPFWLYFSVRR